VARTVVSVRVAERRNEDADRDYRRAELDGTAGDVGSPDEAR
jgi:hypothetical protein